jgi:deoxycytidylate deaminase
MQTLSPAPSPELVFGLIAPIGVDLESVATVLADMLGEMQYSASTFRLTSLMREIPVGLPLDATPHIESYKQRIAYANAVRQKLGNDAMAAMAISAIRSFRKEQNATPNSSETENTGDGDIHIEETTIPNKAYIIRQLKRPEEVALLRSVYGRQFILVSAYAPEEWRKKRIEQKERESTGGLRPEIDIEHNVKELITQDSKESQEVNGQNVRDAFPLGDVFIDASSRSSCEKSLRRFIHLLFGSNEITPTHDEYGMYMAKSASLRSSDLSRQVGAAVFLPTGEIAALGCNEVPKAGGGTYWAEDDHDRRDFVEGRDPNELRKVEVLVDVLDRLWRGKHLSESLMQMPDSMTLARQLLADKADHSVSESKIMDLIEFGRIIHAEMSAICDAARKGIPLGNGRLFSTTFPCHICAKHIVASGIDEVVYLEPYAKSYASDLHSDSISLDQKTSSNKVNFRAFLGVSPFRYRDLFEKGRRKYSGGIAQRWQRDVKRPMIEIYYPQYFKAEALVVGALGDKIKGLATAESQV